MKKFSIILALDNENGIGKCNDLAWDIPEDRKYFKKITTETQDANKKNAVIMGRKTWESIPEKFRPFSNRKNYILSRSFTNWEIHDEWAICFSSLKVCLQHIEQDTNIEQIFIIWGAELYNSVVSHPDLERAYITRIYDKFHCDVFFDGVPDSKFREISRSKTYQYQGIEYEFVVYKQKNKLQKLLSVFG